MEPDTYFARPIDEGAKAGLWAVTLPVAALFLIIGATKLIAPAADLAQFAEWGYPGWFVYVVGVIEVAGALMMLLPRTAFYGGMLLFTEMVGASLTRIAVGDWAYLWFTLALGAITAVIALSRRPAYVDQRLHIPHPVP